MTQTTLIKSVAIRVYKGAGNTLGMLHIALYGTPKGFGSNLSERMRHSSL